MLDKIGIPKRLAWGFLGVVLFMMGDGLEQGWLSPFLIENGLTVQQSASIFSIYGIALAIASWFSGVCLEAFGAKRTMFMGLLFYVIGTAAFIVFGFEQLNLPVMYVTYFVKGLGYPLFAYSFLTWVIYRTPQNKLSTAVGWFWIAYCLGMFVFGAWYSSYAIKAFGYLNTLWSSIFWVCLGALFALFINKDRFEKKKRKRSETAEELLKGVTILLRIRGCLQGESSESSTALVHMVSQSFCRYTWLSTEFQPMCGCRFGERFFWETLCLTLSLELSAINSAGKIPLFGLAESAAVFSPSYYIMLLFSPVEV